MIFNILRRFNFTLTLMIIVFNKYNGTGNVLITIDKLNKLNIPEAGCLLPDAR